MTEAEKLLVESNELLRSAHSVAEREGKDTNWSAFTKRLADALERQHKLTNELRYAFRQEAK